MRRYPFLLISCLCFLSVSGIGEAADEGCSVILTTRTFSPDSHQLSFYEDGTTLIAIDGRRVTGSDGHIPKIEVVSILLRIGEDEWQVAREATRTLYEPHVFGRDCTEGCAFACDSRSPVFSMSGGDGAGSYQALFVFQPLRANESGWVVRVLSENPSPDNPSWTHFELSRKTASK